MYYSNRLAQRFGELSLAPIEALGESCYPREPAFGGVFKRLRVAAALSNVRPPMLLERRYRRESNINHEAF
jgi:hypothetical protein